MSDRETGGPAFPGINAEMTGIDSDGCERWDNEAGGGMTLRDYFAGKALAGYWAESGHDVSPEDCEITAQQCYCMADAMIAERAN